MGEPFQDLMVSVWRAVCRHLEITESAATLFELLSDVLPVRRLLVQRIERTLGLVETVAAFPGGLSDEQGHAIARGVDVERLVRWCRREEIQHVRAGGGQRSLLKIALPVDAVGEILVGPLVGSHGSLGLLIVEAEADVAFRTAHEGVFQAVLEPFAVALENDHRLRELEALREAAESEKRSLLARLGRESLEETIIGETGGLAAVMERVELVSKSDVPVLILGETGSGKEVIARAVHHRSPFAKGPFIRVNCGAIPPELIDSELFGHESGSFTGATGTRRGWFERANEGTLFLDEIGELPLAAQVRLLRVLQDGLFERVGGEEARQVEVRIVAATHRDLASMVQRGDFREDLWYRIAVFPIMLPPLRERLHDIPALSEHFAQRAAIRFGLKPIQPTPEHIRQLSAYPWPGNVREFGSVLDRAAILGDGRTLEIIKSLGVGVGRSADPQLESRSDGVAVPDAEIETLEQVMRRHIERTLVATRGRVEGRDGAAQLLDINPHTLRARMRKLGIDWARIRDSLGG